MILLVGIYMDTSFWHTRYSGGLSVVPHDQMQLVVMTACSSGNRLSQRQDTAQESDHLLTYILRLQWSLSYLDVPKGRRLEAFAEEILQSPKPDEVCEHLSLEHRGGQDFESLIAKVRSQLSIAHQEGGYMISICLE